MIGCRVVLLVAMMLAAGTAFSGVPPTYAETNQPTAAEKAAAEKALAKKAELQKRRDAARQFLQQVMEGQLPQENPASAAPDAAVPVPPDKGGAK